MDRTFLPLCCLLLTVLPLSGCFPLRPSNEFLEIMIGVVGQEEMRAHRSVDATGAMTGGHLSGAAHQPMVTRGRGTMSPEDMKKLRNLVYRIGRVTLGQPAPTDVPQPPGSLRVDIRLVVGGGGWATHLRETVAKREDFSPDVGAIWDVLAKYREVGFW
ncbi:MAG: hypothetical protein COX57_02005 [Alphaproteobacteria bacterium CG_4_10_14_0_2_um_filter_63_37]|nr:MAG: hypothetical protein AUJ55_06505 [Proteobacteria bacterium CG1_02_64_396]PJA25779.1 MAG: hypothetical protein COX57_02005 [Alphaproteobacteria bacterium CG_4_10_14_0_2_um_filter_63_37]